MSTDGAACMPMMHADQFLMNHVSACLTRTHVESGVPMMHHECVCCIMHFREAPRWLVIP